MISTARYVIHVSCRMVHSIRSNISLRLFRALFSVKEVRTVSARVKIKYEYDNFWKRKKISGCVPPKTVSRENTWKMFSERLLPVLSIFYRHSRLVEVKAARFLEIWFLRFKSRSPHRKTRMWAYVCLLRAAKVFPADICSWKCIIPRGFRGLIFEKYHPLRQSAIYVFKKKSRLNFTSRYLVKRPQV